MIFYRYIILPILKTFSLVIFIVSTVEATNIKNSATVFMYHKFGVSKYPSTSVTLAQLEEHVTELTKEKYNILPLNYIMDTILNEFCPSNKPCNSKLKEFPSSSISVNSPKLSIIRFKLVV